MHTITLDFETFYSVEYSLRRLTNEAYVRDPRFEPLCLAYKEFGQLGHVCGGANFIEKWIEEQDWENIAVIMHHAQFDGFILSEVYNVRPAFIFDTLSMSRAVNGPLERASLDALVRRYSLPQKSVPYNKFRGKRWADMDDALRAELCSGCLLDAGLTEELFKILLKGFPKDELEIIDQTVRMYTEPRVLGDAPLFKDIAEKEEARKADALEELGIKEAHLQSTATLTRLLEVLGEDVPVKPGKTKQDGSPGVPVPCLAADDDYMLDNSARDDVVGKLLRARLDVKSTLTETRAGRLRYMSERGPLPIYHKYFAAVTGRWGGGEKTNIQNLPRAGGMRSALMAPPGQHFFILDFSQIEYRILCALAGQQDKLDALASGRDLYCEFGTALFGRTITREDKTERQFAKVVVLGSGYGTGKDKCAATAKGLGFEMSRAVTDRAIDLYRAEHPMVCALWRRCDQALTVIAGGGKCHLEGTPLRFENHAIILPNGLRSRFDLIWCAETKQWFRRTSRSDRRGEPGDKRNVLLSKGYTSYWGGGLTEFCCQALARIRLSELVLKAHRELGVSPVFLVHDEYVGLTKPEDRATAAVYLSDMIEMAREPSSWWPDGPPFDAEGHTAERYGK